MLLAAVGYARYDAYVMDGDGTAFMDIAGDLNNGHPGLAINGYWNPGYPAVIALAEKLTHPSLWRELVVLRYTNILIFAAAMAACLFFTAGLARARAAFADVERDAAMSAGALNLLGLALLLLSMGRELPIAAPRSDTLLVVFLLLAMGLVLRLLTRVQLWMFPLLGLALGCAYLTKSFGFLPSVLLIVSLLIYGLLRKDGSRGLWLGGVLAAAIVFALVAGPYILAISRQLGHFTTGESARLNYAFFVDYTPRWHEWYRHDLGHAGGTFLHPEAVLAAPPAVFSYTAHPYGTFPLWFDPAWWTLGLKPHVWLPGHISRFLRNLVLLLRYVLNRPEVFILLAVLLAFGASWPALRNRRDLRSASLWAAPPLLWGLLMFGIYLPIDFQDRYLTAPFLLVLLPLFAVLRVRQKTPGPQTSPDGRHWPAVLTANALVLLFAGLGLSQAVTYLAERRRNTPRAEQHHPGYGREIFTAAAGLEQLGVRPGDKLACMSDVACYTDHYWARIAGAQILAQVDTPDEADPLAVWNSIGNKAAITAPLTRLGVRYLVTTFSNSGSKPDGWIQLGNSDFFAYSLQGPVSADTAAAVENLRPTP